MKIKLNEVCGPELRFLSRAKTWQPVVFLISLMWSVWALSAPCLGIQITSPAAAPATVNAEVHNLSTRPAPVNGSAETDLYGGRHSSVTLLGDGTFTGSGSDTGPAATSSQGRTGLLGGQPKSVSALKSYANGLVDSTSAFVDAHLASGEAAFGNNGVDDRNYSVGTHKANAGHNSMETLVKQINTATEGRYHGNGRDQSIFIAVDKTNPNIAYKPVIHYEVITSDASVLEFESANTSQPLVGFPNTVSATDEALVLKSMPAYFDMKVTFHMSEWTQSGGTWTATGNIKKMPMEVADTFIKTSGSGKVVMRINPDVVKGVAHPLNYRFNSKGPQLVRRVWNWGPEAQDVAALYNISIDQAKKLPEPPWARTHLQSNPIAP